MPYRRHGNCVEKKDGNSWVTEKCHEDAESAKKHLAALQANVDHKALEPDVAANKGVYAYRRLEQDDISVNYSAYGAPGKLCGGCYWYKGEDYCHLVESDPLPITAIGGCMRYEPIQRASIEDMLEDFLEDMDEDAVSIGVPSSEGSSRMLDLLRRAFGGKARVDPQITGFKVMEDGEHWVGWWSNNFEDRQKQLFAESAILDYIGRVKSGAVPYPELWWFHVPGTKHGQAEEVFYHNHFAFAYGRFDDTDIAQKFKKYYAKSSGQTLGMSHGFFYPSDQLKDGVFEKFTTFEVTVLPPEYAANPYTTFKTYEEIADMKAQTLPNTEQTRLANILGKDLFAQLTASADANGKALEEQAVRHKSTEDGGNEAELVKAIQDLAGVVVSIKTDVEALKGAAHSGYMKDGEEDKDKQKKSAEPAPEKPNEKGEVTLEALAGVVMGMKQQMDQFFGLQPRASTHPGTLLNERSQIDQATAQYLELKRAQAQQGESLVQQAVKGQFNLDGLGMPVGNGAIPPER